MKVFFRRPQGKPRDPLHPPGSAQNGKLNVVSRQAACHGLQGMALCGSASACSQMQQGQVRKEDIRGGKVLSGAEPPKFKSAHLACVPTHATPCHTMSAFTTSREVCSILTWGQVPASWWCTQCRANLPLGVGVPKSGCREGHRSLGKACHSRHSRA